MLCTLADINGLSADIKMAVVKCTHIAVDIKNMTML